MALLFAVEEINKDPNLLPNVTLGFHIYDNAFQARLSYDVLLSLLSTEKDSFPNFKCVNESSMSVVFGGLNSEASIQLSNMLDLYKIPQVRVCGMKHQRMVEGTSTCLQNEINVQNSLMLQSYAHFPLTAAEHSIACSSSSRLGEYSQRAVIGYIYS